MADEPRQVDLIVHGVDVVTFDDADTVVADGAIAIDGKCVVWLGPRSEVNRRYRGRSSIDGRGAIAMPGMIDAHFHAAQQLFRGKLFAMSRSRKLRVPPWKNYYVPWESLLTPDDVHLSALWSYISMVGVGTTCFLESGGPHPDEMGRAAEKIGIRGALALSTMDSDASLPANMRMTTGEALKANEALVKRWRNHDTIKAWVAVRQIIVATEELQRGIAALAKELDTRVHTHLAEGTYEVDFALARWGMRPAEYLDHLGVFNDRLHTAHAVLLSMDEMNLYAERGVSACHCAYNNYTLGRPRALEMWRRGIPIGIGTDGAAVWGPLDLFRLVHIAHVGQQAIEGTPNHARNITSTHEMMTMALRGGAKAAGMATELGCIAPGRLADVILVASDDPDQGPDVHPSFTVANNVVGRDVRTVIINGRVVMRDREYLTVDIDAVRAKVGTHLKTLMGRYDAIVS